MSDPEVISECRRWLRFAEEDIEEGRRIMRQESPVYRHVCWFGQQKEDLKTRGQEVSEPGPP